MAEVHSPRSMGDHSASPRDLSAEEALSVVHSDEEADTASEVEGTTLSSRSSSSGSSGSGSDSAASSDAEDDTEYSEHEYAQGPSFEEYSAADHHAALGDLMHEEDAHRRERAGAELRRLHQPSYAASRGSPRAPGSHAALPRERAFRARALAHPAVALARRTAPATFACSACRAPLLRPCDVKRGEDVELPVAFCDSAETLCAAPSASGVREVGRCWEADTEPEEEVGDDGFYLEVPLIFAARCRHVACRGCGLVLGVRVLSLRRRHPHELAPALLRLQQRLARSVASTAFGAPLPRSASRLAMEAAEGLHERFDETAVGLDYLGVRLLRLLRGAENGGGGGGGGGGAAAAARESEAEPLDLRCACCTLPLATSDQVLCTSRCWSLYGGAPESSCFVNSLRPGSYELRDARAVQLSQGRFEMADAYCSGCGEKVGYGFVKDLSASQENFNQVGRFGLVSRCIAWGEAPADDGYLLEMEDSWGSDAAAEAAFGGVGGSTDAAAPAAPPARQYHLAPEASTPLAPPGLDGELAVSATTQEQQQDDCTMDDSE